MTELKKLQITLEEGYKLPEWWYLPEKEGLTIDLNSRIGDTSLFKGWFVYVGEDDNYNFFVEKYGVTEPLEGYEGTDFKLSIHVKCRPKEGSYNKEKTRLLTYLIYPPLRV